jgi:hypothetical protein
VIAPQVIAIVTVTNDHTTVKLDRDERFRVIAELHAAIRALEQHERQINFIEIEPL